MDVSRTQGGGELGDLEPGTGQRAQLRARVIDIALAALCLVLALWTVWSVVGLVRGTAGWAYSVVACALLGVALTARTAGIRRRSLRSGR
ncbi:hypothetical protein BU52_16675 [Streptomyces toyocaensis]|uniref:Uncharacterized protein n=1 Tax=Streptomyces toyocaensis TaxID=55952 RepID=A0A081XR81_STRTO|nr:hypothetical protein [Streptomyces toyocaensis]KES06054.1 hypothetical protein BU52_16675 [Streptomyces toyocaensis]